MKKRFWVWVARIAGDRLWQIGYCPTCDACGIEGCCEAEQCRKIVCLHGETYGADLKRDMERHMALREEVDRWFKEQDRPFMNTHYPELCWLLNPVFADNTFEFDHEEKKWTILNA